MISSTQILRTELLTPYYFFARTAANFARIHTHMYWQQAPEYSAKRPVIKKCIYLYKAVNTVGLLCSIRVTYLFTQVCIPNTQYTMDSRTFHPVRIFIYNIEIQSEWLYKKLYLIYIKWKHLYRVVSFTTHFLNSAFLTLHIYASVFYIIQNSFFLR
jgi:hypothetical protein